VAWVCGRSAAGLLQRDTALSRMRCGRHCVQVWPDASTLAAGLAVGEAVNFLTAFLLSNVRLVPLTQAGWCSETGPVRLLLLALLREKEGSA
jgi:hypothetical protein